MASTAVAAVPSVPSSTESLSVLPTTDIKETDDAKLLELAVTLARQAGVVIAEAVNRPRTFATKSSIIDCVTETDEQCEKIIIASIRQLFPTHKFIAEESYKGDGEYDISDHPTWLIDPIDGTNNFVHGLHYVCVSIAYMIKGVIRVGVVHAPLLGETFTARLGHGAFLNDKKISVSTIDRLDGAAISCEFGYDRTGEGIPWLMARMTSLLASKAQSVRMFGSCALNMCAVASGRTDGYFEGKDKKYGPKPWDSAAAQLIVTEAGGVVGDPDGGPFSLVTGRVLAANSVSMMTQLHRVVANSHRITVNVPSALLADADTPSPSKL